MERIQDLVYTHVQGGQFRWVTVSTLMLALGTILHLVSPSVAGVTPNGNWPRGGPHQCIDV